MVRINVLLSALLLIVLAFTPMAAMNVQAEDAGYETASVPEDDEVMYLGCELVIERFLAQVPEYDYYPDAADSPYVNRVEFNALADLTDVRYWRVESSLTEDGELLVEEKEVLFELPVMPEGRFWVVDMEFEGYLPTRAITFTGPDGITYRYFPALSGMDNLPMLIPYEV